MRIISTLVGLAAAAMVITSCGSDSNAPDNSHVGRYALATIDGNPLPVTFDDGTGFAFTVLAEDLTLNANNTFVQTATFVFTILGERDLPETISCGGSYQRRGTALTLTSTESADCGAGTITATLSDNQVTINDQGSELVFRR